MIHVEDEMPIAIAAKDNAAHESHVISCLALIEWGALQRMRAHSIDKQMGQDKVLYSAAPCCEALLAEIIREQ